jgi:hypothetical protein
VLYRTLGGRCVHRLGDAKPVNRGASYLSRSLSRIRGRSLDDPEISQKLMPRCKNRPSTGYIKLRFQRAEDMRFLAALARTSAGYGCVPAILDRRVHRTRNDVPKLDADHFGYRSYLDCHQQNYNRLAPSTSGP